MDRRLVAVARVIGFVLVLAVTSMPNSAGATGAGAELGVKIDVDVLWITGDVVGVPDSLTFKIFAPRRGGKGRRLWQRCDMTFTGPGKYRCGVDVAEGSLARKRAGSWASKVIADGVLLDKLRFSL